MLFTGILIILLLQGLTDAAPRGESLRELRKLMQQEDEQKALARAFNGDINLWAQSLEQLGLDFAQFVEQCRQSGSHCQQRRVQRRLRSLRHSYSELRAQLEALEVKYAGRISDEEILEPTLQAVEEVLKQYDGTLRLVNAEIYKLVDQ